MCVCVCVCVQVKIRARGGGINGRYVRLSRVSLEEGQCEGQDTHTLTHAHRVGLVKMDREFDFVLDHFERYHTFLNERHSSHL